MTTMHFKIFFYLNVKNLFLTLQFNDAVIVPLDDNHVIGSPKIGPSVGGQNGPKIFSFVHP